MRAGVGRERGCAEGVHLQEHQRQETRRPAQRHGQQPTTKRIKLAGAFSTVPTPRVEVASTAVTASKTAVYTMPPAVAKYESGIPVALLKACDAQGPVVTISQPKKSAFTFGSPIIGDKPVGGFTYLGYQLVKGGDSAPPTGSFAHAADARSGGSVLLPFQECRWNDGWWRRNSLFAHVLVLSPARRFGSSARSLGRRFRGEGDGRDVSAAVGWVPLPVLPDGMQLLSQDLDLVLLLNLDPGRVRVVDVLHLGQPVAEEHGAHLGRVELRGELPPRHALLFGRRVQLPVHVVLLAPLPVVEHEPPHGLLLLLLGRRPAENGRLFLEFLGRPGAALASLG